MEELRLLIDMVKELPEMVLWVLAGYAFYKLTIVGSIYGIIKLLINQLFTYLKTPKHELVKKDEFSRVSSLTITGQMDDLVSQLHRIKGVATTIKTDYIHSHDIEWLRNAIDHYLEIEPHKQEDRP